MDLKEQTKLLKAQLAHMLLSFPEKKDLALDADLTKPLDRVAGVSFLKEHGVDKIFKLDAGQKTLPGCSKRIYLVRPRLLTMKFIADHINTEISQGETRTYMIVMVPRKLHKCVSILEREGVMGHVTIDEFPLELLPIDTDLLSLELPEFFKSFYLEHDTTWLHTVASSLMNVQRLCGKIPNVYCLGKGSKMVYELMQSMFECQREQKSSKYSIGQLYIVDRDIDLVSPLCTPMTYEGLLDEIFGIECSVIDFGPEIAGGNNVSKQLLTNDDEIYSQIRDRHFSNVFAYLSGKAKELQQIYEKKNNLKSVGDMKEFVAKELRVLKSQQKILELHIGACEHIMKAKQKEDFEDYIKIEHSLLEGSDTSGNVSYIEECIHKQFSILLTLRLMCILSQAQEGLSAKDYKSLTTQFIHSHGFQHMITLLNLKKLGLFNEQEASSSQHRTSTVTSRKSSYKALNRKFTLVPKTDDIDLRNPSDASFVFSGAYTPLSCKLIEQILIQDTTIGIQSASHLIGGFHESVATNKAIGKARSAAVDPALKTILVYFLGGVTFSEVAALRFVAKKHGYKVLIATTSVVTGNSLLQSLMESAPR